MHACMHVCMGWLDMFAYTRAGACSVHVCLLVLAQVHLYVCVCVYLCVCVCALAFACVSVGVTTLRLCTFVRAYVQTYVDPSVGGRCECFKVATTQSLGGTSTGIQCQKVGKISYCTNSELNCTEFRP